MQYDNLVYLILGAVLVYVSFMSRNKVTREEIIHHHKNTYIGTSVEEVPKNGKDTAKEDEENINSFFN